jgi:hypothetical protein
MKFTIEFNHSELIKIINNGALLSIVEAASEADASTLTATKKIRHEKPMQESDEKAISPEPNAYTPLAEPTQQQAYTAPVQQPVTSSTLTQTNSAVPTVTNDYTMEQLAVAATQIMDAGRTQELRQLLASFGVPALTALPKEQYGAFATQLRALGAKI